MIVILKIFTNNNNTFDFCWLKHHVHSTGSRNAIHTVSPIGHRIETRRLLETIPALPKSHHESRCQQPSREISRSVQTLRSDSQVSQIPNSNQWLLRQQLSQGIPTQTVIKGTSESQTGPENSNEPLDRKAQRTSAACAIQVVTINSHLHTCPQKRHAR